MNYKIAYAIGFHPWEDAEEQPSFAEKIAELFEREESGREPPYGPALDLGTGSGIWGIELAKRGWRVTGVDLVEKALRRARCSPEGHARSSRRSWSYETTAWTRQRRPAPAVPTSPE
jgi:methylase of polypeptide subunit release factors